MTFAFDNSYARLPEHFFVRLPPQPVSAPSLIKLNQPLAERLGLDAEALASPEGVAVLSGNQVPTGADPLAMAYAGHQFGNFVPLLGDGRAILLGEILTSDGARFDLQLKGSGRTPFSRGGDGRAWLGPVLREYIISEAMAGLGIPTTRSLAAVATGEDIFREGPRPGAVLTRVARGHVRVGTFELFASRGDTQGIRQLADYVIRRHFPAAAQSETPYRALLDAVIARQARLVAQWLGVGFIHGVMNTDNMSIAGETIDYGPCAFMDAYHPGTVYSSIDRGGRYAYGNQPRIAHWNLARFAQSLIPILGDGDPNHQELATRQAQEAIDAFPECFRTAYLEVFRAKLGLLEPLDDDFALIESLLGIFESQRADFTNGFRALTEAVALAAQGGGESAFAGLAVLGDWVTRWRDRLARETPLRGQQAPELPDDKARVERMRRANPLIIPRNHRVEAALEAAVEGDLAPFEDLVALLADPWTDRPEAQFLRQPPQPHEVVQQTFCGT